MALFEQAQTSDLPDYYTAGMKQAHFNPYTDNGGSIVAIAGEDYCLIAADTRLIAGYSILTRSQQKLFELTDKTILGCGGCWCDVLNLTRNLAARIQMYKHEHLKTISTPATAQMLSTILYHKRFFPYYISNVLAGLDQDGKGVVFSYDPIGHCARVKFHASGSAGPLLQPLLDNQIGLGNQENADQSPIPLERALEVCKDAFISAKERDVQIGDGVNIKIITQDGIKLDYLKLRVD